jgi:hypothetical protein
MQTDDSQLVALNRSHSLIGLTCSSSAYRGAASCAARPTRWSGSVRGSRTLRGGWCGVV